VRIFSLSPNQTVAGPWGLKLLMMKDEAMSELKEGIGVANCNPLSGTDWGRLLRHEFEESYWDELMAFVEGQRSRYPVYPPANEVFRALELTRCEQTKVVIVGQDPYHRPGQAHGLCFSVPCGVPRPASLVNIHKKLQSDLRLPIPDHGSLELWAHRGVLLLNTTLTVREGKPSSHRGKGWERFTDEVIRVVTEKSDPVFLLWGERAQGKERLITRITGSPGKIIKSSHPSPRSAYRPCGESPPFVASEPFRRANELLGSRRGVDWNLPPWVN
jgi:uracil-DNA glycosylase